VHRSGTGLPRVSLYRSYETQRCRASFSYGLAGISSRWIREEAAMAAITLNTAPRAQPVVRRLKTALLLVRAMGDAFVSYRMRLAAAEAARARPQQRPNASSPETAP
jgi:hypothetical protein